MRILSYSFETALEMSEPVREHDFLLRCQPASTAGQTVLSAQTVVTPDTGLTAQVDGFGNTVLAGRVAAAHRAFSFLSAGRVLVDRAQTVRAPAHPIYRRPSALAAGDDAIAAFARDASGAGAPAAAEDPWGAARRLSGALHGAMAYEPGSTTTTTCAADAFAQRRGVCQDYAHILIAALRSLGVAARYVNGLVVGDGATHAWVEVHDGNGWRGIDPTNDREVDDAYIELARGRDFSDCPIEAGVFRGGADQRQSLHISVRDQSMRA